MRITSFHKFNIPQNHLYNIGKEQTKKLEQSITGKKINRGSDDPVSFNEILMLNKTQNKLDQYNRNIRDAKNLLEKINVSFDSVVDVLQMAKKTSVDAGSGILSEEDKNVLADTLEENIKQILSFANTKHLDRYIFSGQVTNKAPLTYDGNSFEYQGNQGIMRIELSGNISVEVSRSAEDVFVPALDALVELRNALRTGDDITAASESLDNAFTELVDERSRLGVQLNTVETLELAYKETGNDLEYKREQVENVDLAKVFSEYKQLETLYEAAIQGGLSMMRLSILNYL